MTQLKISGTVTERYIHRILRHRCLGRPPRHPSRCVRLVALPSLLQGIEDTQFGSGVTCNIDRAHKTISGSYWGDSHTVGYDECGGAYTGEVAQNYCIAHGFKDPVKESVLIQCTGFPMEPN